MNTFLDQKRWQDKVLLNGWQAADSTAAVIDKATGEQIGSIGIASAATVAKAAAVARAAQPGWFTMPYEERAAIFRKAARLVEENFDELATWIMRESGAIRPKADVELKAAIGILHESAGMPTEPQGLMLPSNSGRMSFARRVPHGVVGVIAPFNFPLILAIRAVSPALATGNCVLLKPDTRTAVVGGVLIARIFEEAGLPPGVLSMLPGGADAGSMLCTDPNVAMVAFTGSTNVGRTVGELCGRHLKKVSLELGGKNSMVVLDDADIDLAAGCAAFGAWLHQGQICMATGRILVHESIADSLIQNLVEKANHLPVGDPMSGTVALGPIISDGQLKQIDSIVKDSVAAGAQLLAGGIHDKLFYRPTVLGNVKPGMRAFDEEIFGPVAAVVTFRNDDEAVELANATEYGLSAAVISRSVGRALALGNRLNTGLLHINDQTVADEPHVPFGGRGASGNGGRVGGPANWEEFTQWQWVTIKDVPPNYPF
ncbi:benzaldehyde dehydrogenase [Azoarcus sp. L1K30]|uniref:benzaldehyde dehydrogenase n=1 Tax=Azoarcus sp. L1K30 TaxID=2820277 RepID=UPI001B833FA2|nr:benzaldehyde dehydrogenase [Azoarcus sp. L1K30]MBR0564697.1 benzaldehyde dehydrogenase [Azoarcus sp. L1K30]